MNRSTLRRVFTLFSIPLMALLILTACGGDDEEVSEAGQDVATRIPNVEGAPALTPFVEGGTPAGGEGAASPVGAASPAPNAAPAAASSIEIIGFDIGWTFDGQSTTPGNPITVTAAPGTTISLPNEGASLHNFSVDAFGISVDMPTGETVQAQIPADAAQGEYEFYCNVPGHKQAGMVGTLVIDPNAAAPAGGEGAASPAGATSAAAAPAEAAAAEVAAVDLDGFDIGWSFDGQSTTPGNPITLTVAPGTTVNLVNSGAALHNFAVDALGIDVDMPVGETVQAQIPADAAPGAYEFYCTVPGHKQAGMVGTLVIQ